MPSVITIPDSDSFNWIIVPATRCIQTVADGAKLSGLLQRSVSALAGQDALLERLDAFLKLAGKHLPTEDVDAAAGPTWPQLAKDLVASGLHEIHAPGIIALWASLEVTVEDTATLILVNNSQALQDFVTLGLKPSKSWVTPLDEATARRVFNRFEQYSREARSISQAYAHILHVLGVDISVPTQVLEQLTELNYVRNCILHRGGIVDARVVQEAPQSGLSPGDVVRVTQESYLRYYDAVGAFAHAILVGTLAGRHARYKPPVA